MNLGYGMIFSLTIGTFMGVFLAYATQDSWVPDPRCRINVRKLSQPTKVTIELYECKIKKEKVYLY